MDTETSEQVQSKQKRGLPPDSVLLPKPKKTLAKRSDAWDAFVRCEVNSEYCICIYCGAQIKCTTSTGTSGLTKHKKACKVYKNFLVGEAKNQKKLASDGNEKASVVPWIFDQAKCRRATVIMLILDELPFSFVDNVGFKHLVSQLCPSYIILSRTTITSDVMKMFISEKAELKSLLCGQRVSLTTDIWTSITTVSYMVTTAHFIDEKWKLNRRIIGFTPVSNHRGDTIAKKLEACLIDWEIKKIFAITVDNASANDRAVGIVKKRLMNWGPDALVLEGEFLHVRCCAHILNLIVKDGLAEKGSCVAGVRNAVKYIRSSSSRLEAFQNKVDEEKITRGNLILDCGTRWNSTYLMLKAALRFRKAFERMAEEDKLYADYFAEEDTITKEKRIGPPSSEDWEIAREMLHFLKKFYDITLIFSASKKVTSSGCYNEICKVAKSLESMAAHPDLGWSNMAKSMKEKYDKYWEGLEKINKILLVATILDPRSKMGFVMLCLEKICGQGNPKCTEIRDEVLALLKKLYEVYYAQYKASGSGRTNASGSTPVVVDEDVCDEEDDDDPFGEWRNMSLDNADVEDTKNELDFYLMEKLESSKRNPLGMDYDVIDFWNRNRSKYPVLALIARDILAIPVSTVASESAFSTSGRILDQYRSSLTHKMVEALLLTQNWLRSSLQFDGTKILKQLSEDNEIIYKNEEEMEKAARGAQRVG